MLPAAPATGCARLALPVLLVQAQIQLPGSASCRRRRRSNTCCRPAAGRTTTSGALRRGVAQRGVRPDRRRRPAARPSRPGERPRDGDHQHPERLHGALPAERDRQPVREPRHDGAADADAEIGKAHRLAACRREPAREQDLDRQRPAEDVAERVEDVTDRTAPASTRGRGRSSRHRPSGYPRAAAARTVAVDHPAGQVPEQRTDDQLAVRIARRDLLARPAEVLRRRSRRRTSARTARCRPRRRAPRRRSRRRDLAVARRLGAGSVRPCGRRGGDRRAHAPAFAALRRA